MSSTPRKMWELLEPIHAVTYFSEEAADSATRAGYRGFWMAYFACRLAPLGAVGPEIATAACYGFDRSRIARALPDAWTFASPEAALSARLGGATAALRRVAREVPELDAAADLAWDAAQHVAEPGRVLAAANRARPRPDDAWGTIWQATTTLREERGDGHNAVLIAAGLTAVQAHWLKIAANETDAQTLAVSRNWPEHEWTQGRVELEARGWLDHAGALTDKGHSAHDDIERQTDAAAAAPWEHLRPERTERLARLIEPLTNAVRHAGIIPFPNPIGLNDAKVPPD